MVVADPDEALIEAIADELSGWQIGTGYYSLTISSTDAREMARAAYTAMVEHLGMVEETRRLADGMAGTTTDLAGITRSFSKPQTVQRRLVSRWVEVDHGSE
jgi:hypothetical protein